MKLLILIKLNKNVFFFHFKGQTAPRQPAQPQTKEELPDIDEESKIQHEVVITGL